MKKKDIFGSIFFILFAPTITLLVVKSLLSIMYMIFCFITWEDSNVMNENLESFMNIHPITIRLLILVTVILIIWCIGDAIKRKNK